MTFGNNGKDPAMTRRWGLAGRPLLLAAGIALAGFGGLAHAAGQDDGKTVVKKKTIVVSSDGSTVIRHGGKIVVSNANVPADIDPDEIQSVQAKALAEARAGLEEVEARLKKTRSKDERKVLEVARDSLKSAIDGLEAGPSAMAFNGFGQIYLDDGDLEGHLKELQLHQGEIEGLRIELRRDLENARGEIDRALEGMEVDVDQNGDITRLRFKALKDASAQLDRTEEQQLKALDRSLEELKRARADLEKRIEERKAREAESAPKGKR